MVRALDAEVQELSYNLRFARMRCALEIERPSLPSSAWERAREFQARLNSVCRRHARRGSERIDLLLLHHGRAGPTRETQGGRGLPYLTVGCTSLTFTRSFLASTR